ncbi:hypothetical protein ACLOAV_006156 [Pseudogymnoascus australis]
MAADNQNIHRQPLSEFAQKYGASKDKSSTNAQDTFQGYKSGHTPNSPPGLASRTGGNAGNLIYQDINVTC